MIRLILSLTTRERLYKLKSGNKEEREEFAKLDCEYSEQVGQIENFEAYV